MRIRRQVAASGLLALALCWAGCGGSESANPDGASVSDAASEVSVGDARLDADLGMGGDITTDLDIFVELPPDTLPPVVKIISPKDGAVVSGEQTIVVDATDDRGVAVVDVYLEDELLGSVTVEPWEVFWDATALATGNYRLVAVATDEAGNVAQDEVEVLVQGSCDESGDCPPKSVKIITPVAGSKVCGKYTVEAVAQDDIGIAEIEFLVDGESLGVDVDSPYQKDWDTKKDPNGEHELKVVARDTAGHEAFASIVVTVNNTGEPCDNPPSVTLDTPLGGAYLYGVVPLAATASDDHGVLKVQYLIDNNVLEEVTYPYKTTWDTSITGEGAHSVKVTAYDTANPPQLADAQIQVTVDRTPPEVEITSPDTEEPFQDILPAAATASDNFVVKQVEFYVEDETEPVVLTKGPYEADLDLSTVSSGWQTLVARAVDGAGHDDEDAVDFLVDRPPVVAFVSPDDGDTVFGQVSVQVNANDDLSEPLLQFFIDGNLVSEQHGETYSWATPYAKAEHVLKVVARDDWDQTATAEISVLVDHPVEANLQRCQGASCQSLTNGTELTGVVKLKVEAKDDGADIDKVEFHVDGNLITVDDDAPWEHQWDTEAFGDGLHTVKAVAVNTLAEKGEDWAEVLVNNCDLDHDTYLAKKCGGTDCDDLNPDKNPGKPDTVGNGIDDNCDGIDGIDADGDGYASVASGGEDCDDSKANVHPCADDIAGDGADANCDGTDVASCDDCNACTLDKLDAGVCKHTAIGEGQACDDGNACTTGEKCTGGVCGAGAALNCGDGNVCTLDACDPVAGCTHGPDPAKAGQPCPGGVCFAGACCAPACAGKVCGDDGCGGSCGTCAQDEECDAQGQCVESSGLLWKPIPGGTFTMGCSPGDTDCYSDEKPPHSVTLSPFEMLETEVTEAQYLAVTGDDPSCDYGAGGGPDSPVECVDWYEAKDFCEAVGGRLCTEAEWEYAARGGTTTKYYCGNSSGCLDGIAWWDDNSGSHKHDVKGKAPNAYGLYDMLGNVWEWTADWYSSGYYSASPANNPKGPNSGSHRVARGGRFDVNVGGLRVSSRYDVYPSAVGDVLGLRCCRSE